MFKYKEITDIILRSFYEAYNELGDGFLEFKRFVYDNKRKNISDNQRRSVAE
jgi:hypothetical protein